MDKDWKRRLVELMELRDTNMRAVSLKAGLGATAVRDMLKRDRVPGADTFAAVAEALDCRLDWLAFGKEPSPYSDVTLVPKPVSRPKVVGMIQAGIWQEEGAFYPDEMPELPTFVDPALGAADVVAFKVIGDSTNLVAPSGSYVIAASYIDIGRGPLDGELAVVARHDAGRVELTLKRVRFINGDIRLDPESDNPRWQEPVWIRSEHGDEHVEIVATHLVLTAVFPVKRL